MWNGPTWQAKTIISSFAINSNCVGCKTTVAVFPARHKHVIGANQSASQECRFATPTKKKERKKKNSAGLRPGLSNNIKMMKAVRGILESETWNKTETENMPNLFVCFNILLQGHFSCVFKV